MSCNSLPILVTYDLVVLSQAVPARPHTHPTAELHLSLFLAATSAGRHRLALRRGGGRGFTLIELLATMSLIGLMTAFAVPRYRDLVERARVAKAIGDIKALQTDILSQDSLPPSLAAINRGSMLDPWGRPYVYYKFPPKKGGGNAPPPGARMDKFLVPVNTQFDLYSLGKDGATAPAFTAKSALDDVVRANDGGYIGLAWKF